MGMARFDAAKELQGQGRYREAERCYLDARRIFAEVEGEESFNIGRVSGILGDMYGVMGRYEEAMTLLHESLRIARITQGERSEEAAAALRCTGVTLSDQGKHNEALARLEEAHSILKEAVGPEQSLLADVIQGCLLPCIRAS